MDLSVPGCRRNHGKRVKIEINKVFLTIATFLARFIE